MGSMGRGCRNPVPAVAAVRGSMGSSFVGLGDKGFWAQDSSLQLWLHCVVHAIDEAPDPPPWLLRARAKWARQARWGGVGCVETALDTYLQPDDRRAVLLEISQQALRRLAQARLVISKDVLNGLPPGTAGSCWTRDVETARVMRIGEAFVALVRGELLSDAATFPVL